jgi:hypothetical protein
MAKAGPHAGKHVGAVRHETISRDLHGAASKDYVDCIADRAALEFFMPRPSLTQRPFLIAATVALMSFPAGVVLAQPAPSAGTAATPPAATTETAADPAKPTRKKAAKKMTRQQEVDKSIDSGTVPARYRSSVPKEYHHLIPFDKR